MRNNKEISIKKDDKKSNVYVYDKEKLIGILYWHLTRKVWVYEAEEKGFIWGGRK